MSVSCMFLDDFQGCCCQVLRDAGAGALPEGVAAHLQEKYCSCGRFIVCPIFLRVQRKLDEVQALRERLRAQDERDAELERSGVQMIPRPARPRRRRRDRSAAGA